MPEVCAILDRNRTQVRDAGGTDVTLYREVRRALCLAVPRIVPHDVERDTPLVLEDFGGERLPGARPKLKWPTPTTTNRDLLAIQLLVWN
jgi:hypothetical protein